MIREYKAGDEIAIAKIEEECFSLPWSSQGIIDACWEGARFFVWEEDGDIFGYIGIRFVMDEGYIYNIAVKENQRRRGIARALLKRLDDLAQELELSFVSLEVRESNAAAISLYEQLGYVSNGIRPNFYTDPRENAVIMTKRR